MSQFVLLNEDGTIFRKLHLVSLPDDYVVPMGKIVSWRSVFRASSKDPLINFSRFREPPEAYFYFGSAWAQVTRGEWKDSVRNEQYGIDYGIRELTITVQSHSASDLVQLRDQVLTIIRSRMQYEISNDLNPKPKVNPLRSLISFFCRPSNNKALAS